MSKAWDLTCTCRKQEYEACPYCLLHIHDGARKMSADWLADTEVSRVDPLEQDAVPRPVEEPKGYHLKKFDRGVYGESSKIMEEVLELQDAEAQGARIMVLHELSDILGAVHGYLRKHYPDMKFEDLVKMANITRRAFESGVRR